MSDRTDLSPMGDIAPPAGKCEEHGIAIETISMPAGNPRRAVCLCGWTSPVVPSTPKAQLAGEEHIAASGQTHEATDTSTGIEVPGPSPIEGMLSIAVDERDPYIDPCPAWCQSRHTVCGHEDDRVHNGSALFVPIRSLPTEYDKTSRSRSWTDALLALERPSLHRNARVHFQFLTPGAQPVMLSIVEAQQIADCLLALVKESRRQHGHVEGAA